jgi:HEPN domain-containing protein/predicted nucleotidyltransferase
MKTTYNHIIPSRRPQILEVIEIIKETANPEMIILFGSYAKGTFVSHRYISNGILYEYQSDMDILVVTKDHPVSENEIAYNIEEKTNHFRYPVSIEVADINYINEGLAFGQYFFSDIIKEGILLYDKGTVGFVERKALTKEEEKVIAESYFNIWYPRSLGFLKTAKFNLTEKEIKIGVFILHQSAECLYYTILLVFTGYKTKSHNLKHLRKQTKGFSDELFEIFPIEKDKSEKHLFDLLKKGYIEARYNPDYSITEEELEVLIEKVEKMQLIVDQICSAKIKTIATGGV